jgi:hypothetical protein
MGFIVITLLGSDTVPYKPHTSSQKTDLEYYFAQNQDKKRNRFKQLMAFSFCRLLLLAAQVMVGSKP